MSSRILTRLLLCMLLLAPTYSLAKAPVLIIFPIKTVITGIAPKGDFNDDFNNALTSTIIKSRRLDLVDRSQLQKIFQEQKFQTTGDVDIETAVEFGKLSGAQFFMMGSFTLDINKETSKGFFSESVRYPANGELHLRVQDVSTGKITETFNIPIKVTENEAAKSYQQLLKELFEKLYREITNVYPLSGYLVKTLENNEIMVDIGKSSGLREGDRLMIFEQGGDFTHPVTGQLIKGEKRTVAEAIVKQLTRDTAIATVAASDSELKLKAGMLIESKPKGQGFLESVMEWFN